MSYLGARQRAPCRARPWRSGIGLAGLARVTQARVALLPIRPPMETPALPSGSKRAALARRLLLLSGAIVLGLVLQNALRARLDEIADLSNRDVLAARAELALVFRVVGTLVFGVTGALGFSLALSGRRASEPRARLGLGLGVALVAASLAGLGLIWYMAAVLDACRA